MSCQNKLVLTYESGKVLVYGVYYDVMVAKSTKYELAISRMLL